MSDDDLLQAAQQLGVVWGGNNPRSHPAFEHGDYYTGPDDMGLNPPSLLPGETPSFFSSWDILSNNHTLIASDDAANRNARVDMKTLLSR